MFLIYTPIFLLYFLMTFSYIPIFWTLQRAWHPGIIITHAGWMLIWSAVISELKGVLSLWVPTVMENLEIWNHPGKVMDFCLFSRSHRKLIFRGKSRGILFAFTSSLLSFMLSRVTHAMPLTEKNRASCHSGRFPPGCIRKKLPSRTK